MSFLTNTTEWAQQTGTVSRCACPNPSMILPLAHSSASIDPLHFSASSGLGSYTLTGRELLWNRLLALTHRFCLYNHTALGRKGQRACLPLCLPRAAHGMNTRGLRYMPEKWMAQIEQPSLLAYKKAILSTIVNFNKMWHWRCYQLPSTHESLPQIEWSRKAGSLCCLSRLFGYARDVVNILQLFFNPKGRNTLLVYACIKPGYSFLPLSPAY